MSLETILSRHRGPYMFCLYRPGARAGFSRSQFLPDLIEPEDVADRARALLGNAEDRIEGVSVWSTHSDQFVTTISGERDL